MKDTPGTYAAWAQRAVSSIDWETVELAVLGGVILLTRVQPVIAVPMLVSYGISKELIRWYNGRS